MRILVFAAALMTWQVGHAAAAPWRAAASCNGVARVVDAGPTTCPRPLSTQRLVLPPPSFRA